MLQPATRVAPNLYNTSNATEGNLEHIHLKNLIYLIHVIHQIHQIHQAHLIHHQIHLMYATLFLHFFLIRRRLKHFSFSKKEKKKNEGCANWREEIKREKTTDWLKLFWSVDSLRSITSWIIYRRRRKHRKNCETALCKVWIVENVFFTKERGKEVKEG